MKKGSRGQGYKGNQGVIVAARRSRLLPAESRKMWGSTVSSTPKCRSSDPRDEFIPGHCA